VRQICPDCREFYPPADADVLSLKELGLDPDRLKDGMLARGRGCGSCFGSGYQNRTGIYEILPIDDPMRELIVERASASKMKRSALNHGFRTLRMDGAEKVARGLTTMEEVLRVTQLDVL
jgi:general secretion pathway protein E